MDSQENVNVDGLIESVARKEAELNAKIADLKSKYKQTFDDLEALTVQLDECVKAKEEIKALLIQREDFDLHKAGGMKVSVCPIVKLEVEDIDKVDDKFKSTEVVADVKKAQEAQKLFGETPEGFKDKTYYRMTWKDANAK